MPKKLQINLKGFTKNITTRLETLQGIDYIVAPVTMIVEGVLPGSAGPILYTSNEMAASVSFWDNIPVTINHPTDSDGNPVSARMPAVIEEYGIGQIYNTTFDSTTNSLKAEAWLNKAVLEEKFPEVYAAIIDDNVNMEISTGVFFDDRGEPGTFGDTAYNSTAYNYHGDHLALLPNATGACSWSDGCGLRANSSTKNKKEYTMNKEKQLFFNEISSNDISYALSRYIDSLDNNEYYYYVDNRYDNYFTFERIERSEQRNRTLWKQSYTNINNIVTPTGTPQRVTESRVYTVVPEDTLQTSGTPTITNANQKKESDMADDKTPCCPEKVKSLIAAQNAFTEADEPALLTMNEKQLESVIAMSERTITTNSMETEKGGKELETTEEFLKNAPEHIKLRMNSLLKKEEDEKANVIENILKDDNCTFTEKELGIYELDVLQKMAVLAKKEEKESVQEEKADMTGNAGSQTNEDLGEKKNLSAEETLPIPKVNWTESK